MINSSVIGLSSLLSQLMLEQLCREPNGDGLVSQDEYPQIEGWLKIALHVAEDFELQGVHNRVSLIKRKMGFGITQGRLATEYRILRETLDFELRGQHIYRYPAEQAVVLKEWKNDWLPALGSFPSAQSDILAAVDLWALSHPTACVFHLMRVLEHGIKALASDVGKTFDIQNWQNILDEIESEIRSQSRTLPRGIAKAERLQFLSEAAKEFHFFKDGWRNYVSHNRAVYDQNQARIVMDHVRSFMNVLSSHLSE